jgi:nucleotide-binding universal stress UspA family protein
MLPIRSILYPTDFSENGELAFRLACSLARDQGAQLVLLHVYPSPLCHGEVVARRQDEGYYEELWAELERLQPAGIDAARRLEEGDPGEVIPRVAAEAGCDLIVMATHGHTGLAHALMGSVAEEVVRRAACPVLTIKSPLLAGPVGTTERREEASAHFPT